MMGGPTQTKKKQITCDSLSIDIYGIFCYKEKMNSKKEKCKNCDGSGKIEFDSYNIFDVTSKPKTSIKKCKRCNGTGLKKTD